MLDLAIGSLSEPELQEAIHYYCSQFGKVKGIKVREPADGGQHGVAAVEMSTPVEADKVVVKIGDVKFGSTAIIRLRHEEKPIPVSLKRDIGFAAASAARAPLEILLVEDDLADVRIAQDELKAAGIPHHLHVVDNGLDAISFLYRTRQFDNVPEPDLILLGLDIPKLSGHEVLTEIRARHDLEHIPVVVLSRAAAGNDDRESREADADYFMINPSGLDAFANDMGEIATLLDPSNGSSAM